MNDLKKVFNFLDKKYSNNQDPWGLNLETCQKAAKLFYPLYRNYFKVRVFGKENVEDRPYMLTSNHSGQIAIDGALINMAFLLDVEPPRIVRGMVERFLSDLPFLGSLTAEAGSILGDRDNCQYLLSKGETILVFPEGVRGIAKNTKDFYKLQEFTRGFFRLAVQNKIDILPIAVVGAEEFYPFVYHFKTLAKFLNLPAFPVTPIFPFLGPLGIIPLPSPVDIYIGKPFKVPEHLSYDSPDKEINEYIYQIENQIKEMLNQGLKNRRPFWASKAKDYIKLLGK